MPNFIEQTLDRVSKLGQFGGLAKAGITSGSGLTFYDLEAEAKLLYPVLAPIRKRMPRIGNKGGGQGLAAHWNIITNPNSTNTTAVIEEGKRGAQITPTVAPKVATYKGLGLEGIVTWESDWAAEGYDDVRAIAQRTTLDSMILAEEPMLLWGNSGNSGTGLQFGTTPTPVGTPSTSGGSIAAGTTNFIYAVALSHQGWVLSVQANAVQQSISRLNADGTTTVVNAGSAQVSAASSAVTTTGTTSSITAKVAAVKGAAAYAWFAGASAGAANAFFSQITPTNVATITSIPSSGQNVSQLTAADYSYNPLAFDGLITQAMASNGYFGSLDGAALTHDGSGGVVEIDAVFKYFWDTYRTSPTRIYWGSQIARDVTRAVTNGGASSTYQLRGQVTPGGEITASLAVSSYTNKFAWGGAKPVPCEIHPNLPDGHMFFDCEFNPYPTANIPVARAVRTRKDYFQVLWPIVSRNWQNGIYADQCLQVYVPYSMGLLSNIGPGFN